MRISEADIVFVPGLGGSGSDHWQSRWAQKMSTGQTVDLPDLDTPRLDEWIRAIRQTIGACQRPVLIVGHSLGSIAAVHAAQTMPQLEAHGASPFRTVRGAVLVTPPSAR
ncbi:MAG: alpha/beta hydrolase, partial [Beijerinckiaceae bacterium]|nr:alpha/beta hydrolase [Beijerinckiaceae bacterium]